MPLLKKVVYLSDWLPPDFGAVGQYSLHFARERARSGQHVVLVGLSSQRASLEQEELGAGRLTVIRIKATTYDRSSLAHRLVWTLHTNLRLIWSARRYMRWADEVVFTGSPPFMLHFLAPLNAILRRRLVYRITDFHPECLMASLKRTPLALWLFYRVTIALRKTIRCFEVLGEDQRLRLERIGIPGERISLKRDISPVRFHKDTTPLPAPRELKGFVTLLYSGNFGVAHDYKTFVEGYRLHHLAGTGRVALWLNATGAKADEVESMIRQAGLPLHRSRPLPLEELARLLVTPDAHLITLSDSFVGYVMPSKVYGCIESGREILYVGSRQSDIYLLCSQRLAGDAFHQIAVGDAEAVAVALERIADRALDRRWSDDAPALRRGCALADRPHPRVPDRPYRALLDERADQIGTNSA